MEITQEQLSAIKQRGAETMQRLMNSSVNALFWRVLNFNYDGGNACNLKVLSDEKKNKELDMILEEVNELREAFKLDDRKEIADAIGDTIFVLMGTAGKLGIDLPRVMFEICDSNETKYQEDGTLKKVDGKITKGPNFKKPDLSFVEEPIDFNKDIESARNEYAKQQSLPGIIEQGGTPKELESDTGKRLLLN
jgi:phosphoribosyl-ATP pyrophosphohydrolase